MTLLDAKIDSPIANSQAASLELTVVIHTRNSGVHIKKTIASILHQTGVRFDVVVINNGSTDNTASQVNGFSDPRIKLVENNEAKGRVESLLAAAKLTPAPFIAEVGDQDLVLPGCLRKLMDEFSEPDTGMVHCYSFEVDQKGETTREAFRRRRAKVIRGDTGVDSIRIYRRTALEQNASLIHRPRPVTIDALDQRISDQFQVMLVPEFLYARRIADNSATAGVEPPLLSVKRYLFNLKDRIKRSISTCQWNIRKRFAAAANSAAVTHLSWWPAGLSQARGRTKREQKKIAYYIWHFPVLSQTFVNRELVALQLSGLKVQIIADGAESLKFGDENAKLLMPHARYLDPPARGLLRTFGKPFFKQNPLRFLSLLIFVFTHRHDPHKSFEDDLYLFGRAAHLAQLLEELDIDHIHTPWADQTAYIALLAARLCGITYSVQARAHDIHRKSYLFGLREKFENAEFVVTNTLYNQEHIKSLIAEQHHEKVKLIYNGIDLDRFVPRVDCSPTSGPVRILCVARLIEQKGFPYLLEALSWLRKRGHDFRCEIIGGAERPLYAAYLIQVRKLHRKLNLEDCVFFLDAQPFNAVMEKYAEADIFVLASVIAEDGSRDITPNSLIEAMAMKLPVISTTVTGIPEIVEDGVSGLLVPPNDADAIACTLERLIQEPDLRTKLGKAARERVEERFNIRRNNVRRSELFSKVLKREGM